MSRKQNWYIGRYVRAVSGFLPCSGKVKKPLLDTLRAQAEEYIEGGGDAAALEQRFGTPQQVAAAIFHNIFNKKVFVDKLYVTC